MSVAVDAVLLSSLVMKSYHICVIPYVTSGMWLMPVLLRQWQQMLYRSIKICLPLN